jgi:hypothetical protein
MQMADQPVNTGRAAYGILKKGRIGGALLYGPPGTGKTHLARVLARECQATMISASAADIENMYVGETEKAIKGLFNLGRLLAPSIIFIDEADSLFHARGPGDRTWERSRINQLLTEMDGLVKVKTPPFVLLATNFPRQLDHAVLRRAPSRLHIGIPSFESRKKIFHICLREEKIGDNVDWEELAYITQGYSGSDIQTMCVQTALICETSPADIDINGVRTIKKAHFQKAFERCAPTVSRAALSQIREFAKEFDPSTWAKMKGDEDQERVTQEAYIKAAAVTATNEHKTLRPDHVHVKPTSPGTSGSHIYPAPKVPEQPMNYVVHPPSWPPPSFVNSVLMEPAARIEEVESIADDDQQSESVEQSEGVEQSKLHYIPLANNNKEIRVLSIEPSTGETDISVTEPLRCTLENVSLQDWSPLYRAILHKLEVAGLRKDSPYDKFLLWHLANILLHRRINGKPRLKHDNFEEIGIQLMNEVVPLMNSNYDIEMEEMEPLEPRFNWGDYIALSYVWGNPRKTREIFVNGNRFAVGENLYLALRKLQSSFEVRERRLKIWIDAICINQSDLNERAQEVKKMDMIYSEALAVRAWIGEPPPNTTREFRTAKSWLKGIRNTELTDVVAALVPDSEVAHALWGLASGLFYEPYWQRLWIMQVSQPYHAQDLMCSAERLILPLRLLDDHF